MTLGAVVLKQLLGHLGIKSLTLANQLEVEDKRLQNVETGKTKKISGVLANKISEKYPEISLSWLLTGEGTTLTPHSEASTEEEEGLEEYRGACIVPADEIESGDLRWVEIPVVPYKARTGALVGFGDPEWQDGKQTMPVLLDKRVSSDYLIYEVAGDSMDDGSNNAFLEGDFLLCRILPQSDWQYGIKKHRDTFCVIATESEGIILKQVTRHDKAEGVITCHSLNLEYKDYDIPLSDVKAIFYVEELAKRKL